MGHPPCFLKKVPVDPARPPAAAALRRAQRASRLACRRCARAWLCAWIALARLLANCRTFCVSLAAALTALLRWALRTAACWPAASRSGDVFRIEAFLLMAMPHLLIDTNDIRGGRPFLDPVTVT